jgi:hypothetical protein
MYECIQQYLIRGHHNPNILQDKIPYVLTAPRVDIIL